MKSITGQTLLLGPITKKKIDITTTKDRLRKGSCKGRLPTSTILKTLGSDHV